VTAVAKTEIVWLFLAAGGSRSCLLRRRGCRPARIGSELLGGVVAEVVKGSRGQGLSRGRDDGVVLRQGERVHIRLGAGDRAVPAPTGRSRPRLAERARFVEAFAIALSSARPGVIKATFPGYLVDRGTGALIATAAVSCRSTCS
jgi:hypothetical protein